MITSMYDREDKNNGANFNSVNLNLSAVNLGQDYERMLNKDFYTGEDIRKMFRLIPPEIQYYEATSEKGKFEVNYPAHAVLTNWLNAWIAYKEGRRLDNPLNSWKVTVKLKQLLEMGRRQKAEELGAMGLAILHSYSNITFDYLDYRPRVFLKWTGDYEKRPLDYGGNICIIYGTQGSGKTSKALKLFVENAIPEGIKVMGNIQIENDLEGYTYVTRESEILLNAISNAMKDEPSLVIKDEQQLGGFDRTHTTTIENQEDDAIIRLTRKLKLSEVRIWHEERKIASSVLGSVRMMVKCYGGTEEKAKPLRRKATFINMKDGTQDSSFDVEGIPNTSLKFKTDDPAPFIMDVSITHIYQYLAKIMGQTTNEKSHYEKLRDEILIHKKFYDETGKRVDRKTLKEFQNWREENKLPE
jgi:hypothetical protein